MYIDRYTDTCMSKAFPMIYIRQMSFALGNKNFDKKEHSTQTDLWDIIIILVPASARYDVQAIQNNIISWRQCEWMATH